jgi:hypothetical protein
VVANSLLYQYICKTYSVVEIYAEAALAILYSEVTSSIIKNEKYHLFHARYPALSLPRTATLFGLLGQISEGITIRRNVDIY